MPTGLVILLQPFKNYDIIFIKDFPEAEVETAKLLQIFCSFRLNNTLIAFCIMNIWFSFNFCDILQMHMAKTEWMMTWKYFVFVCQSYIYRGKEYFYKIDTFWWHSKQQTLWKLSKHCKCIRLSGFKDKYI